MGAGSSSCMAATNGWDQEDVKNANRAIERWQLVQKGLTTEEADALIAEEEAKAKEGPQDLSNTLLGRLGGVGSIKWIFSDFYKRIMTENRVNSFFVGVDMSMIRGMPVRMSAFMCHIFSGPGQFEKPYRGQDLHKYMRKIHIPLIRDKHLSRDHFDVLLVHMETSLSAAKISAVVVTEALATIAKVKHVIFDPAADEPPGMTDEPVGEPFHDALGATGQGAAIAVAEGMQDMDGDPARLAPARRKKCPFTGFSLTASGLNME